MRSTQGNRFPLQPTTFELLSQEGVDTAVQEFFYFTKLSGKCLPIAPTQPRIDGTVDMRPDFSSNINHLSHLRFPFAGTAAQQIATTAYSTHLSCGGHPCGIRRRIVSTRDSRYPSIYRPRTGPRRSRSCPQDPRSKIVSPVSGTLQGELCVCTSTYVNIV